MHSKALAQVFILAGLTLVGLLVLAPAVQGQGGDQEALLPFVPAEDSNVVIDGTVADGEYTLGQTDKETGITFYLEHDKTNMNVALVVDTTGWVGIGFNAQGSGMQGANLLLGFVDGDGQANFSDGYGKGYSFEPDTAANGTDDVIDFAVKQTGEVLTLEFSYPLATNSTHDYDLTVGGKASFFISVNRGTDSDGVPHTARSFVYTLTVASKQVQATTTAIEAPAGTLQTGQQAPIKVRVAAGGSPVLDGEVSLYRLTSFGRLFIAKTTLEDGVATFYYKPTVAGEVTLQARFHTSGAFSGSTVDQEVTIAGEGVELEYGANSEIGWKWRAPYVVGILIIIGGVWTTLLSSVRLLFVLRSDPDAAEMAAASTAPGDAPVSEEVQP